MPKRGRFPDEAMQGEGEPDESRAIRAADFEYLAPPASLQYVPSPSARPAVDILFRNRRRALSNWRSWEWDERMLGTERTKQIY